MIREYDKLIQKVVDETGLSKLKVELAIASQFKGVKRLIESGDFENIRLRYLGKFEVSKKRIENLKK